MKNIKIDQRCRTRKFKLMSSVTKKIPVSGTETGP
jgi:hypothetical protein